MKPIAPDGLDALAAGGAEWALLDVRDAWEADRAHILGASFLPRRVIETRVGTLVHDRGTPVVVYDEGGDRAQRAAETLERLGYRDARVLAGGTAAWLASGRRLVSGTNVPSKIFGEQVGEHDHVPHVPPATLAAWQREGRRHLVCDIRTPDEYAASRIPGARGAFGVDLALLAADLRARGETIVVHCAGRTRSIIACQTLRALGVGDVHALENGTMGWQLAGYGLERDAPGGMLAPSAASAAAGEASARTLARGAAVEEITAAELERQLAARAAGGLNLYVFDVRQLPEYVAGHVAGAVAVPGGLLIQRTDEFAPVRAARVVLIDDREARALLTGYWLRRMGFPNVAVLAGGLAAWRESGRAVAAGRGRERALGLDEARALVRSVPPEALAAASQALVLDVDTSAFFRKARVPGAVWMPYGWLETRIGVRANTKDVPIVVTCRNGLYSTFAGANLARLGYRDVGVLEGGLAAWEAAGQPVETGWPAELGPPQDVVVPPYRAGPEAMASYLAWELKLTADPYAAGRPSPQ